MGRCALNFPVASALDAVQGSLDALGERLEDFDAGEVLVVGLDQGPGGDLGAGAVDHVADGGLVGVPLLAVAPVLGGDLEALEAGLLPRLEASEELHDSAFVERQ